MSIVYLAAPGSAAQAVGLSCRTGAIGDDPAVTFALGGIASRICALMNVGTLEPVTTIDYFDFPFQPDPPRTRQARLVWGLGQPSPYVTQKLRLTNGFVDPTSVVITNPNGGSVTPFSDDVFGGRRHFIDKRLGTIDVNSPWVEGQWAVTYNSGLPLFIDPDNPPQEGDIPILDTSSEPWLQNLLAIIFRIYNVTAGGQKIQEGLRFDAFDNALRVELSAWGYSMYERPRYGVLFPTFSERVS